MGVKKIMKTLQCVLRAQFATECTLVYFQSLNPSQNVRTAFFKDFGMPNECICYHCV